MWRATRKPGLRAGQLAWEARQAGAAGERDPLLGSRIAPTVCGAFITGSQFAYICFAFVHDRNTRYVAGVTQPG